MANELKQAEAGTQGIRRILRREIKKASKGLAPRQPHSDAGLHDVRTDLKKARAARHGAGCSGTEATSGE